MKNIVIIPTLNENDNINYLFKLIVNKFKIPILFIDDNSSDGTQEKILNLSKKSKSAAEEIQSKVNKEIFQKIEQLNTLHEKGLITKEEFEAKKKELLDRM